MGIPDELPASRHSAYLRRQEEKSFRGLLKLFNRACDATGRPRYEEFSPPLPIGGAASLPAQPVSTVDPLTSVSSTQDHAIPEQVSEPIRPPPGLGWGPAIPQAPALDTTSAVRIQAVWRGFCSRRAAVSPVRRLGILEAAAEGATPKMVVAQRAWRRSRRRRAQALLVSAGPSLKSSLDEWLPTTEAHVVLAESFMLPAVREMQQEGDDYELATRLGRCWYSALRRLETLGHGESHISIGGSTFEDHVKEAVHASTWRLCKMQGRMRWDWDDVESSYDHIASGIQSTANEQRRWLMRTRGYSEAAADAAVAQTMAEAVRRRGFVPPPHV